MIPNGQTNLNAYTLEFWLGSIVIIVTAYGLDGLGIESKLGRDFPHLFRLILGPTQSPVQWVLCCLGGGGFVVRCSQGVMLTPHPLLVPRSNKRVELYFYSPKDLRGL
jgi:hypothetical protein